MGYLQIISNDRFTSFAKKWHHLEKMALQRQIQIISNFLKCLAGLSLFAEMTLMRQIRGFCCNLILQQIISNLHQLHLPLYEQPIITITATMPPGNNMANPLQQGPNNPSCKPDDPSDQLGTNKSLQRPSRECSYSKIKLIFQQIYSNQPPGTPLMCKQRWL